VVTKLIRILEDDLDGTEASETITFGLDGQSYEIDLNSSHAEELRNILSRYAAAGRKEASTGRRTSHPVRPAVNKTGAIRQWAREQGLEVSARGRIQAEILTKYESAHRQPG
jgi:hypothetical protein